MGPRAAQIEALDRHAIRGPSRDRSEGEHLVRKNRSVEDIASGETVFPLHVERGPRTDRNRRSAYVRRVQFKDVEDPLRELAGLRVPGTRREVERRELRRDR